MLIGALVIEMTYFAGRGRQRAVAALTIAETAAGEAAAVGALVTDSQAAFARRASLSVPVSADSEDFSFNFALSEEPNEDRPRS